MQDCGVDSIGLEDIFIMENGVGTLVCFNMINADMSPSDDPSGRAV